MEDDQQKRGNISILNFIDKKILILIICAFLFYLYLISKVQPVSNEQEVCRFVDNITVTLNNCDGMLKDKKGKVNCCKVGYVYPLDDKDVPKGGISIGQGLFGAILFALAFYLIIKNTQSPDFLNYYWAEKVMKSHIQYYHPKNQFKIGPENKLSYFPEKQQPFKWLMAVMMIDHTGNESYYIGEATAFWRSSILEDHFMALKRKKSPVTFADLNREEWADRIYIPSYRAMKEMASRQMSEKK